MEIYKRKLKKERHFLIQKAEKKNKLLTNERKTGAYENMTELQPIELCFCFDVIIDRLFMTK